jgi:hypothetical protein
MEGWRDGEKERREGEMDGWRGGWIDRQMGGWKDGAREERRDGWVRVNNLMEAF